jgi:uncharacterized protein YjbJ (UPF0337 family)
MNWDHIEGNWGEMKGSIRQKWGLLTDLDYLQIAGNRDKFIERLQERYGHTREEVEEELNEWLHSAGVAEAPPKVQTGGSSY